MAFGKSTMSLLSDRNSCRSFVSPYHRFRDDRVLQLLLVVCIVAQSYSGVAVSTWSLYSAQKINRRASSPTHPRKSSKLCASGSSLVFGSCRMDLNDSNGGFSKSVVKDPRHRSVVFSAFLSLKCPDLVWIPEDRFYWNIVEWIFCGPLCAGLKGFFKMKIHAFTCMVSDTN